MEGRRAERPRRGLLRGRAASGVRAAAASGSGAGAEGEVCVARPERLGTRGAAGDAAAGVRGCMMPWGAGGSGRWGRSRRCWGPDGGRTGGDGRGRPTWPQTGGSTALGCGPRGLQRLACSRGATGAFKATSARRAVKVTGWTAVQSVGILATGETWGCRAPLFPAGGAQRAREWAGGTGRRTCIPLGAGNAQPDRSPTPGMPTLDVHGFDSDPRCRCTPSMCFFFP